MTTSFKLTSPLKTHKGEIAELTLKSPKGRTFLNNAAPYEFCYDAQGGYRTTYNTKAMFAFLSDMSGLDTIILEEIDGCDVFPLFAVVMTELNSRPQ